MQDLAPSGKQLGIHLAQWALAFAILYPLPLVALLYAGEYLPLIVYYAVVLPSFAAAALYIPAYLRSVKYHLGEEHVKMSEGVLTKHEVVVPYDRISAVHVFQGYMARSRGIGDVRLRLLGSGDIPQDVSLRGLENFGEVRDQLVERLRAPSGPGTKEKRTSEELLEDIYEELIDIKAGLARP